MSNQQKKLGEIFVENGWLLEEELHEFLEFQSKKRKAGASENETRLGQILLKEGLIDEKTLNFLLEQQLNDSQSKVIPPNTFSRNSFNQRYKIIKKIGSGGMGTVQLVKDTILGREVALKKLHKRFSKKQHHWRFQREAEITALLEHPNIVPLYDMEKNEAGEISFTMRKVQGETLRQFFMQQRNKKIFFHENEWLSIFRKVCDAVAYAHSINVIHRDLKPENIMIGKFGEVYVMDWGIAKIVVIKDQPEKKNKIVESDLTEKKELNEMITRTVLSEIQNVPETIGVIGTPGYMSPEQIKDAAKVAFSSDIYALGKILEECFSFHSPMEKLQAQMKENIQKLKEESFENTSSFKTREHHIPKKPEKIIPGDIKAIIEKACHQEPKERYKTIINLLEDLTRYEQHLRVKARDYGISEILYKWRLRYQKQLSVFLLVFITGLGIVFYFHHQKYQKSEIAYKFSQDWTQKAEIAQTTEESIAALLNALNQINLALSFSERNELKEKKWKIGKRLSLEACKTKNFQLARHTAKEMSFLHNISYEKREKLLAEVDTAQKATLKFNLEQLEHWQEKLRKQLLGRDQNEIAILEISKMKEPEIRKQLLQVLNEGIQYFLKEKEHSLIKTQYYFTLLKALGHLAAPLVAKNLITGLEQLTQSWSKAVFLSNLQMDFLVELSKALSYTKAQNIRPSFLEIRQKMGQNGAFWERTRSHYLQISQREQQTVVNNGKGYLERSILFLDQKKFKKALEEVNQAILRDPKLRFSYYTRANIYSFLRNYSEAIKDYTTALKQEPLHLEALLNRGNAYKMQGNKKKALKDYQKALAKNTKFIEAYINISIIYREQKALNQAIETLNRALKFAPEYPELYFNRGLVFVALENFEEALKDFSKSILLNPRMSKAYIAHGRLMEEQGYFNAAFQDYQKARQVQPQNPFSYLYLARLKKREGKLEEALTNINQALSLKPDWEEAKRERILFYWENNKENKAIEELQEILKKETASAESWYLRALFYHEKGKRKEAAKFYKRTLQKDSKHVKALMQLINLQKNEDKAIKIMTQFLKEQRNIEVEKKLSALSLKRCIEARTKQKDWKKALYYGKIYLKYASPESKIMRRKIDEIVQQAKNELEKKNK